MSVLKTLFTNFKDFYYEINGATLTGAIDVIVVEQPDGEFLCSPFHVRFGKYGVLRSREKIVDIEINGEPVDIHMKLGESGQAFFVEKCSEDEEVSDDLATSPIEGNEFYKLDIKNEHVTSTCVDEPSVLPIPRRNSFGTINDSADDTINKLEFENQVSSYSKRRYTDNSLDRRNLSVAKKEYTTQKIRQEWAQHGVDLMQLKSLTQMKDENNSEVTKNEIEYKPQYTNKKTESIDEEKENIENTVTFAEKQNINVQETTKSKKKRRKNRRKNSFQQNSFQHKDPSCSSFASYKTAEWNDIPDIDAVLSNNGNNNIDGGIEIDYNKTDSSTASESNNYTKKTIAENTIGSEKNLQQKGSRKSFELHFFSDTEIGQSPSSSRLSTPIQSDSELERQRMKDQNDDSITWGWGKLSPLPPPQSKSLSTNSKEQQQQRTSMLSGMFNFMKKTNKMRKNANVMPNNEGIYLSDLEAATDSNPEIAALYFPSNDKNTSLNTHAENEEDNESGKGTSLSPSSMDSSYDRGTERNSNFIAISMCGKLDTENGPTDEEFERDRICYSDATVEQLTHINMIEIRSEGDINKIEEPKQGYSWWSWRRTENQSNNKKQLNLDMNQEKELQKVKIHQNIALDIPFSTNNHSFDKYERNGKQKFRKTLRLSSDIIKNLNLRSGMNEIEFSVTTAYQGTSRCKCCLFRWKYNDKIVVSDIDGTITRSDVLGHILPMFNRDWAQNGVAELFTKISANGYKILYLSARAIGQATTTREYLRSIRQGDLRLPDGPILLNPTSLITAFHSEVIQKNPERFKIECLTDIQSLFFENPFYAGYGNRVNDTFAYNAIKIPLERNFTINPQGQLKHVTQTLHTTYKNQSLEVDEIFPFLVDDEERIHDNFDDVQFDESDNYIDDSDISENEIKT